MAVLQIQLVLLYSKGATIYGPYSLAGEWGELWNAKCGLTVCKGCLAGLCYFVISSYFWHYLSEAF